MCSKKIESNVEEKSEKEIAKSQAFFLRMFVVPLFASLAGIFKGLKKSCGRKPFLTIT